MVMNFIYKTSAANSLEPDIGVAIQSPSKQCSKRWQ